MELLKKNLNYIFSPFRRFFKPEFETSDCLVCLTQAVFNPISSMRGICKHLDSEYDGEPRFEIMKFKLKIIYLGALILLLKCIFHLQGTMKNCSMNVINSMECLIEIEDFLIVLIPAIMIVINLSKLKTSETSLDIFCNVLNKKDFYKFDYFICEDSSSRIIQLSKFTYIFGIISYIVMVIIMITNKLLNISVSDICFVICYGIQLLMVVEITIEQKVFQRIFTSYKNRIRSYMNKKIYENENEDSFIEQIQKFQHLYGEIILIFRMESDYWNPTLLIWSLSTLFSLTINVYTIILLLSIQDFQQHLEVHLRTYISIIAIVSINTNGDSIIEIVSIIISFLIIDMISKVSQN